MKRLMRRTAAAVLDAASRLLPPHMTSWSRAMQRELAEIQDDAAALAFIYGCLRTVLLLALAAQLRSACVVARRSLSSVFAAQGSFATVKRIMDGPWTVGLICGAGAVGLGIVYMLVAGAPSSYLGVNLGSLVIGVTAWAALRPTARSRLAGGGYVTLCLASLLVLTSLFGVAADGASRWVTLGPLTVQVSLILLPPMLVIYARQPDAVATFGMLAAAVALALQPDRAMAGVLMTALIALALSARRPLEIAAAAAAVLAFGYTLLVPDNLTAVPYVDGVFYSAFDAGLLAGLAVVVGAAALVAPAAIGLLMNVGDRAPLLAFGGCWAAVVAAAALGNYPTPLVGYGGAAVLGYLLSAGLLTKGISEPAAGGLRSRPPADDGDDQIRSELRGAQLA